MAVNDNDKDKDKDVEDKDKDKEPDKEATIEGGPEVKVEKDAEPGIAGEEEEKPMTPVDERKELLQMKEDLKKDREDFKKEREDFSREWDEKVEEIESMRELTETPDKEDLDEDEDFDEDEEESGGEIYKKVKKDVPESGEGDSEVPKEFVQELKDEIGEADPDVPDGFVKDVITELRASKQARLDRLEKVETDVQEIKIRGDLKDAEKQYPKMDKDEVLIGIERDPSAKVSDLAKKSHEKWEGKEKEIRKDVESQQKDEGEKPDQVPSQPGDAPADKSKDTEEPIKDAASHDPWDKAKKSAKDDLGVK